jgi:effector-binding domain-containing protein
MSTAALDPPRIWLRQLAERHVAAIRATCPPHRARRTVADLLEMVMDAVGLQGLAPAGPLYARYHQVGSVVDLEAGIPLAQPIVAQGLVTPGTLPAGPALCTIHTGLPGELHRKVRALRAFAKRAGLVATGGHWESYLSHPPRRGDGRECQVAVFLPVARVGAKGQDRVSPQQTLTGSRRVALPVERRSDVVSRPTGEPGRCVAIGAGRATRRG